jgi:hypothetical protein
MAGAYDVGFNLRIVLSALLFQDAAPKYLLNTTLSVKGSIPFGTNWFCSSVG